MAVYTYFGGIEGLWRAVRQEGFTRLAQRLADVPETTDPVHDLAALGASYAQNALANPHLYRTMFDDAFPLDGPDTANRAFQVLVRTAARAAEAGRFVRTADAAAIATRFWITGHGVVMLVITGVLPPTAINEHSLPTMEAIFTAAGDDPARCRRSLRAGWASETSRAAEQFGTP